MARTPRKARRGRGEGSVYLDERTGLWVGVVDLGIINGKRVRRVVRAKKKPDLLAKLQALQADPGPKPSAQTVTELDPHLTTGEWLTWWADNMLPGHVAANTEAQYRQVSRDWVGPYVGDIPLVDLRPEHVVAMLRALDDKGLSPTTQRLARTILRRSLTHAERFERVTRNAAALTDAPKKGPSKLDDSLDATAAAKVLKAAEGDRLEALAVLVIAVGVRQAEALDLRWADLDLDGGTITVHGTKTKASQRRVALPPFVAAALRRHHLAQLEERLAAPVWVDDGLVFTTTIGTRIHRRNVLRWWHRLTVRAGVGRRRFHASRHTAATLMLNNGVPLEVVSTTLGHAGLSITADVYAKVRPELQRRAADAMEQVLGGGGR
jgi:integrase